MQKSTPKLWWARIGSGTGYGRWVPTGSVNLREAQDYISTYYATWVEEWLLL